VCSRSLLRFNYSAKHNTRSPKKYFTEIFSKKFHFYDLFFGSWREKKLALQFREGRDKGQTKCFFQFFCLIFFIFSENFSFFFLGNFFLRFFGFLDRCLPSVSLGPWFESQALPDLWSPRVWFTFRNLKVCGFF